MIWGLMGELLAWAGWKAGQHPVVYGLMAAVLLAVGTVVALLWSQLEATQLAWMRDRRSREELEAYLRLDTRVGRGVDLHGVAAKVCRAVSEQSPFQRVAMLMRDVNGKLYLAASFGVQTETVAVVEQWAADAGECGEAGGVRLGVRSTVVPFGDAGERGVVIPLYAGRKRMVGALVVMAASVLDVRRRAAEEAVVTLEVLGMKLGRSIEAAEVSERLLKAEKLAGLGALAGGIAHTLNNPLTVVMGYAELMGEVTQEEPMRHGAEVILAEARRMREIVESLQHFWRPPVRREEAVDMTSLVRTMAKECEQKLIEKSIRLEVQVAPDAMLPVRGSSSRLRLVMEHLMNNAAQAIAAARAASARGKGEASRRDAIRLTVSQEEGGVQVIVSDTGTGFREPERVFDPFYTTQSIDEGNGLGLSICYGIVREHGGEISAFNLHPAGAAIVVELPVAEVVRSEPVVIGEVA